MNAQIHLILCSVADFLRDADDEMNVTEELLDLQSLKDQTRGTDLFGSN